MVGISKGTVAFIKATDFLKGVKRLKHGEIAEKIGLTRSQYDQSRGGRRVVLEPEIIKLKESYPEVARFFEEIKENFKEPSENYFSKDEKTKSNIKLYVDMIAAKDEIIKLKDEKIEFLENQLNAANLSHSNTLLRLYTEEEIQEEIQKRMIELNKLRREKKQ